MLLVGRTFGADYRFGFNTLEQDKEIAGKGNSYTAEFWTYSPIIVKRWNPDPVVKYHESPYACFANNPICFVDPDGADTLIVVSSSLNSNGDKLEKGDTPLYLFTAYSKDNRKGEIDAATFLKNYQTLAENVTSTSDGKSSDERTYAKFIKANSEISLLSKAMYCTTLGEIDNWGNEALKAVGGKNGGLSSSEKLKYFNHGSKYDFKDKKANGMTLTYVSGVGVFESDHIGNIIYGSVAGRAGQGLGSTLFDGDFLTKGLNADNPYDSYALALGSKHGYNGITKFTLTNSQMVFNKSVQKVYYTVRTSDGNQARVGLNINYNLTTYGKNFTYSHIIQ